MGSIFFHFASEEAKPPRGKEFTQRKTAGQCESQDLEAWSSGSKVHLLTSKLVQEGQARTQEAELRELPKDEIFKTEIRILTIFFQPPHRLSSGPLLGDSSQQNKIKWRPGLKIPQADKTIQVI